VCKNIRETSGRESQASGLVALHWMQGTFRHAPLPVRGSFGEPTLARANQHDFRARALHPAEAIALNFVSRFFSWPYMASAHSLD